MNSGTICQVCQKPKATLECGACHDTICKSCAEFTDDSTFELMMTVPAELSHTTYCSRCFDATVAPALEKYREISERAKNVQVYFNNQGKETRLLKRKKDDRLKVENVGDRDLALMKMAYAAADRGFDGLIDVGVTSKKVRVGGYQTLTWAGEGMMCDLSAGYIPKSRAFWDNPN